MRRVNESALWDFYWARDSDGRNLLVLRAAGGAMPRTRLPQLRGVDVFVESGEANDKSSLIVRLLDAASQDIFHQLCIDIMSSTVEAGTESEAVARSVARTWRWHYLLRGGRGLLSADRQKGLIGELIVLESYLLGSLSAGAAVDAWRGPLGAAQDFSSGRIRIESKARSSARSAEVNISSEHQLNVEAGEVLFLHLTVLYSPTVEDAAGFTVTEVAQRLHDRISSSDSIAVGRYEALLEAAGFAFADDYSAFPWIGGERCVFFVGDSFPRIVPERLPSGVANVSYTLALQVCAEFIVASSVLDLALRGEA
jgi:hypothetical protein